MTASTDFIRRVNPRISRGVGTALAGVDVARDTAMAQRRVSSYTPGARVYCRDRESEAGE